ncbi:MAG: hypothetical protein AB1755_06640, partial [Candidatus Omnitrophota bacterium]
KKQGNLKAKSVKRKAKSYNLKLRMKVKTNELANCRAEELFLSLHKHVFGLFQTRHKYTKAQMVTLYK